MEKVLPKKYFDKYKKDLAQMPNLVKDQVESFKWLLEKGVKEVMDEFTAVNDFTGKKFKFEFTGFSIEKPKYDEYFAKEKKLTYEATLKAKVKLTNKTLNVGDTKEDKPRYMHHKRCRKSQRPSTRKVIWSVFHKNGSKRQACFWCKNNPFKRCMDRN